MKIQNVNFKNLKIVLFEPIEIENLILMIWAGTQKMR